MEFAWEVVRCLVTPHVLSRTGLRGFVFLRHFPLTFLKVWWPNATLFAFIFLYTVDPIIHHSFINIR